VSTDHARLRQMLDDQVEYGIALQRAIYSHVHGQPVKPEVAVLCPHAAKMLNDSLAELKQQKVCT